MRLRQPTAKLIVVDYSAARLKLICCSLCLRSQVVTFGTQQLSGQIYRVYKHTRNMLPVDGRGHKRIGRRHVSVGWLMPVDWQKQELDHAHVASNSHQTGMDYGMPRFSWTPIFTI